MTALPRMSAEEITDLARRVVTNEVYLGFNEDNMQAFNGILMMALSEMDDEKVGSIGLVWEEWSKRMPLYANGLPMFLSCHFVHIDDVEALVTEIRRMEDALGITAGGPS